MTRGKKTGESFWTKDGRNLFIDGKLFYSADLILNFAMQVNCIRDEYYGLINEDGLLLHPNGKIAYDGMVAVDKYQKVYKHLKKQPKAYQDNIRAIALGPDYDTTKYKPRI